MIKVLEGNLLYLVIFLSSFATFLALISHIPLFIKKAILVIGCAIFSSAVVQNVFIDDAFEHFDFL